MTKTVQNKSKKKNNRKNACELFY